MSFLSRLQRSITTQLAVLLVLIFAPLISQFVLSPLLFTMEIDPLEHTRSAAQLEFEGSLNASDASDGRTDIQTSQQLARIAKANPELRYYWEFDGEVLSSGEPPRFRDLKYWSQIEVSNGALSNAGCARLMQEQLQFDENGSRGIARLDTCDGMVRYYELAGVTAPAFSRFDIFTQHWAEGPAAPLLLSMAAAIMAIIVYLRSTGSLRNAAKLAEDVDLDRPGQAIDFSNFPLEIRPMADSVNSLLRRMDSARERERFFLATAAHELRTPLTMMRTRMQELPPGHDRDALIKHVQSLARLVEQLLLLSKVRNSEQHPKETIALPRLLREICADRAVLAIEKGVELNLELAAETDSIEGNRTLVGVAVSNLVNNAISVSNEGNEITVTLSDAGLITIRDFGPGIPDEQRKHLFEPFAKFPPNRDGHGLGLAIVEAIMRFHNGEVWHDAPQDRRSGSLFCLRFPSAQDVHAIEDIEKLETRVSTSSAQAT